MKKIDTEPRSVSEALALVAKKEKSGAHYIAYDLDKGIDDAKEMMAAFRKAAEELIRSRLDPKYIPPTRRQLFKGRPANESRLDDYPPAA